MVVIAHLTPAITLMMKGKMMMMEMVRERESGRERERERVIEIERGGDKTNCKELHIHVYYSSEYKTFKNRDDFLSIDDYARYVKENIKVGMMVKCCEAYEEVGHGDIGRVMKVSTKFNLKSLPICMLYPTVYVCTAHFKGACCCMS